MNNYEKHKEIIDELWENGHNFSIENGKIKACMDADCTKCDFNKIGRCLINANKWLVAEYEEPHIERKERNKNGI